MRCRVQGGRDMQVGELLIDSATARRKRRWQKKGLAHESDDLINDRPVLQLPISEFLAPGPCVERLPDAAHDRSDASGGLFQMSPRLQFT